MNRLTRCGIVSMALIFLIGNVMLADGEAQTKRESFVLDGSLHKTYSLERNGSFTLENHNGDIEIVSWDKQEVDIEIIERYGWEDEKIEIEIISSGNRLEVVARRPDFFDRSWWGSNRQTPQAEFKVKVPKQVELDVNSHNGEIDVTDIEGKVMLETHNGRVTTNTVNGNVKIETHNGDIEVGNLTGDFQAESHNGEVELDVATGEVDVRVHNGSIRFRDVKCKEMFAETNNGRIYGNFEPDDNGNYDFSTHNGRIDVSIPGESNLDVEVRCKLREFDSEFKELEELVRDRHDRWDDWDDRVRVRGKINNGGGRLSMQAYNGSIRLRSR